MVWVSPENLYAFSKVRIEILISHWAHLQYIDLDHTWAYILQLMAQRHFHGQTCEPGNGNVTKYVGNQLCDAAWRRCLLGAVSRRTTVDERTSGLLRFIWINFRTSGITESACSKVQIWNQQVVFFAGCAARNWDARSSSFWTERTRVSQNLRLIRLIPHQSRTSASQQLQVVADSISTAETQPATSLVAFAGWNTVAGKGVMKFIVISHRGVYTWSIGYYRLHAHHIIFCLLYIQPTINYSVQTSSN